MSYSGAPYVQHRSTLEVEEEKLMRIPRRGKEAPKAGVAARDLPQYFFYFKKITN